MFFVMLLYVDMLKQQCVSLVLHLFQRISHNSNAQVSVIINWGVMNCSNYMLSVRVYYI